MGACARLRLYVRVRVCRCACMQVCRCVCVPLCTCAYAQLRMCARMRMCDHGTLRGIGAVIGQPGRKPGRSSCARTRPGRRSRPSRAGIWRRRPPGGRHGRPPSIPRRRSRAPQRGSTAPPQKGQALSLKVPRLSRSSSGSMRRTISMGVELDAISTLLS